MKPKIYAGTVLKIAKLFETAKGKRIYIKFPFTRETLLQIKSIKYRVYEPDGKYWTVPLNLENIEILKSFEFNFDEGLKEFYRKSKIRVEQLPLIEIPGLKGELRRFQNTAVAFTELKNGNCLILDDMGCGKTIEALAYLQLHPEFRPAIIVCPSNAKINWAREAHKWVQDARIQILYGQTPTQIWGKIIIINYDILQYWLDELKNISAEILITDEAQFYKNSETKIAKTIKKLAKTIPHVIPMSGTLVEISPFDIYNAVHLVDPNIFPNPLDFKMRYCDAKFNGFGWEFKGATNIEELHEKIKPIMIRRLKEDVLSELPGKTFSFVPLELDNQKEYLEAENDFINYVKNKTEIEIRSAFKDFIEDSNQMLIFNDERLEELKEEKASKANPLSQMNALKQLAVKGKLKHAIAWIDEFMETGNKLVVFAWHQFVIDELVKAFPKISVKLDGRDNSIQKQKAIDAFQCDPACKLFIGQEKAAGVAITLTAASHAAILEYPWNPMTLKQDYDRLDRIGQKNAVNIYQLLGLNTIEEKIAKILDERMQMSSGILDGKTISTKILITELIKEYQKY